MKAKLGHLSPHSEPNPTRQGPPKPRVEHFLPLDTSLETQVYTRVLIVCLDEVVITVAWTGECLEAGGDPQGP